MLYPASYNREGLLGDYEVYVVQGSLAQPLSGRRGPYTSIKEWFQNVGEMILEREPDYVLAMLKPGVDSRGRVSGARGKESFRCMRLLSGHFKTYRCHKPY